MSAFIVHNLGLVVMGRLSKCHLSKYLLRSATWRF
jgi:hypothetical protein